MGSPVLGFRGSRKSPGRKKNFSRKKMGVREAASFLRAYAAAHPHRRLRLYGSDDDASIVRSTTYAILSDADDALSDAPLSIPCVRDASNAHVLHELVVPFLECLEGAPLAQSVFVCRNIGTRLDAGVYVPPTHLEAAVVFVDAMGFYGTDATFRDVFGVGWEAMVPLARDYTGGDAVAALFEARCDVVSRLELCAALGDVAVEALRSLDAQTRLMNFVVPVVRLRIGARAVGYVLEKALDACADELGAWVGEWLHELCDDSVARHFAILVRLGAFERRFDQLCRAHHLGVALDPVSTARLLFYAAYVSDRDDEGLRFAQCAVRCTGPSAVSLTPLGVILGACCIVPAWRGLLDEARALVVEAIRSCETRASRTRAVALLVRSSACVRCCPHPCGAVCAMRLSLVAVLCRALPSSLLCRVGGALSDDGLRLRALIALADDVSESDDALLDATALAPPAASRRALVAVLVG